MVFGKRTKTDIRSNLKSSKKVESQQLVTESQQVKKENGQMKRDQKKVQVDQQQQQELRLNRALGEI